VLKLSGYRDPAALRTALEYVQGAAYRSQAFPAYAAARAKPAVYTLRGHPQFAKVSDFKGYAKPLAILFEDRGCAECARFHDRTLAHPDVVAEMKKFLCVRLDTDSSAQVVDVEGKRVTPAQWARSLGLAHRPALALYDEGREIALKAFGKTAPGYLRGKVFLRYLDKRWIVARPGPAATFPVAQGRFDLPGRIPPALDAEPALQVFDERCHALRTPCRCRLERLLDHAGQLVVDTVAPRGRPAL